MRTLFTSSVIAIAAFAAAPASAAIVVTSVPLDLSGKIFAAPSNAAATLDFNDGNIAGEAAARGFSFAGTGIVGAFQGAETVSVPGWFNDQKFSPIWYGDDSKYLGVGYGSSATFTSSNGVGYGAITLAFGSLDLQNHFSLLGADGSILRTVLGREIGPLAWNMRATFTATDGDLIHGIRLWNPDDNGASLEVDNISFVNPVAAAVPEPATWAMMIAGFFVAGLALRTRRRPALAA